MDHNFSTTTDLFGILYIKFEIFKNKYDFTVVHFISPLVYLNHWFTVWLNKDHYRRLIDISTVDRATRQCPQKIDKYKKPTNKIEIIT